MVGGHDLYGGTFRLLERVFKRWGLEVAFAADSSPEAHDQAIASCAVPACYGSKHPQTHCSTSWIFLRCRVLPRAIR